MSTGARLESALLSLALVQIAVITLSALAFGGVVYVAAMPFFSGERKASKRVATVAHGQGKSRVRVSAQPLQMRRKQVQGVYRYSTATGPGEVMRSAVGQFVEKTLSGSVSPFVAWMSERAEVSDNELAELEALVHQLQSRRKET